MNKRLFVDIHVLQNVPPSCINRDDTGSPKTAVYGGVTRARISSQAWKRACRIHFNDPTTEENRGIRTKSIVLLIADEICKLDDQIDYEQAKEWSINALSAVGLKIKSAEKGTDSLFFMSSAQAKALAEILVNDPEAQKKTVSTEIKNRLKEALKNQPSADIALFGRMVADDPSLNTDAACQVAHAISTHSVETEFDFFTAVDDCAPEDNAGAGHLGTVEFNSSTLYRYGTIAYHELQSHLGEAAAEAVCAFVDAFALSMPTGKQNTFANRTLPTYLMVCLREDQPVNFVGAFERPVSQTNMGYMEPSVHELIKHVQESYRNFVSEPVKCMVIGENLSEIGEKMSFAKLKESLKKELQNIEV